MSTISPTTSSEPPTPSDLMDQVLPIAGVILVAGPPALIIAAPLVLLALAMVGAFLLIVTYVVVAVATVAVVGVAVAVPYRVGRRAAAHWAARPVAAHEPASGHMVPRAAASV
jgi:hypothetical protein